MNTNNDKYLSNEEEITTIFKVITIMANPFREHIDLRTNREAALSYFNGVKNNKDCLAICVEEYANSENSDIIEYIETIANYKKENNTSKDFCR